MRIGGFGSRCAPHGGSGMMRIVTPRLFQILRCQAQRSAGFAHLFRRSFHRIDGASLGRDHRNRGMFQHWRPRFAGQRHSPGPDRLRQINEPTRAARPTAQFFPVSQRAMASGTGRALRTLPGLGTRVSTSVESTGRANLSASSISGARPCG